MANSKDGQGHKDIPVGKSHHNKMLMCNMNTYYLEEKINVNVFFKKVKIQGQSKRVKKIMVYMERSCHQEYKCEISKVISNVKDFKK